MADLKYNTADIRTCANEIEAAGQEILAAVTNLTESIGSMVGEYWQTNAGQAFLEKFMSQAVALLAGYIGFAQEVSTGLNNAADKLDKIESEEAPKIKYNTVGN
jgi:uncharacterized protein YukE